MDRGVEWEEGVEGGDAAGAELGSGLVVEFVEGVVGGSGGAVDAGGEHGVEGVGDVDDAGAEGDVFAGELVGVAVSVPAFVVVADGGDGVLEEAEAADDAGAFFGVGLDGVAFVGGEGAGFEEDGVGDGEFADVVEEGCVAEEVEFGVESPRTVADGEGELLDAAGVAGGVGVAGVDGGGE